MSDYTLYCVRGEYYVETSARETNADINPPTSAFWPLINKADMTSIELRDYGHRELFKVNANTLTFDYIDGLHG